MRGGINLLTHTHRHIYQLTYTYIHTCALVANCIFRVCMCSDEENVPEATEAPSARPSRRAKMAALDKTRQDLTALMNHEASA